MTTNKDFYSDQLADVAAHARHSQSTASAFRVAGARMALRAQESGRLSEPDASTEFAVLMWTEKDVEIQSTAVKATQNINLRSPRRTETKEVTEFEPRALTQQDGPGGPLTLGDVEQAAIFRGPDAALAVRQQVGPGISFAVPKEFLGAFANMKHTVDHNTGNPLRDLAQDL